MPWLDILRLLTPILLELLDKNKAARSEAASNLESVFLTAARAREPAIMLAALAFGCVLQMDDQQFDRVKGHLTGLQRGLDDIGGEK